MFVRHHHHHRCAIRAFAWFATACIAVSASSQPPAPPQPPATPSQSQQVPPEVAAANEAFDAEDWAKAAELYKVAIAAGYEYAFVQMRTGYALHVLGKYDEALPFHLKAANARQRELRVDGLYNAACAYALTDKKEKSYEFLEKAIDSGFLDKKQIETDSDLNALRGEERFQKIVASIGTSPVLSQWMDFFIGEWEQHDAEGGGEVLAHFAMSRPLSGSSAIVTTSRNPGGGQWTGLVWPDSDERVWRWTAADGSGTTHEFVGARIEFDGRPGMRFEGRDVSPAGPNVDVRLTFSVSEDGRVREHAEVSSDGGATWRTHHEAWYVRVKKPIAPATQPAERVR